MTFTPGDIVEVFNSGERYAYTRDGSIGVIRGYAWGKYTVEFFKCTGNIDNPFFRKYADNTFEIVPEVLRLADLEDPEIRLVVAKGLV